MEVEYGVAEQRLGSSLFTQKLAMTLYTLNIQYIPVRPSQIGRVGGGIWDSRGVFVLVLFELHVPLLWCRWSCSTPSLSTGNVGVLGCRVFDAGGTGEVLSRGTGPGRGAFMDERA